MHLLSHLSPLSFLFAAITLAGREPCLPGTASVSPQVRFGLGCKQFSRSSYSSSFYSVQLLESVRELVLSDEN